MGVRFQRLVIIYRVFKTNIALFNNYVHIFYSEWRKGSIGFKMMGVLLLFFRKILFKTVKSNIQGMFSTKSFVQIVFGHAKVMKFLTIFCKIMKTAKN